MRISQKNGNGRRPESAQCTTSPRPQAADSRLRLRKSSRILKRQRFKEIACARNRYFGKILTIDYCHGAKTKLGITVVRQFGCSVLRNRFKRLVREAFRLNLACLAPIEMVVMPKKGVSEYSLDQITQDLLELQHVAQSRAKPSC